MKLHIGDGLNLPVEAVTQTFCILAKRGVGKSYTASVMAEEMLKAGQTVIALDPTGAWWGLRSLYPVVIFGGEHADVPLEESAGEVIAKSIVDNRFPAVLDLSLFRKRQMIRFMVAFAETLYRLNREAVHLFVDEADAFAPQARNYGGDENRMLGAMEDIVRRGRKRGIGCTLITQRPAVLNKNVLTQAECLIALRMNHPKDIGAIEEWVNVHADPAVAEEMIDSLPSLAVGEAWFWSPGWGDIFKRVRVRQRETFDSGATPKAGETPKRPKHLAEIDLAKLGEQIKATVEKAKADDPRELKRRIAELERQAKARPSERVEVPVEKRVEVPVLRNGQLDRTEKIADRLEAVATKALAEASELKRLISPAFAPKPVAVRPAPRDPVMRTGGGNPLTNRQREKVMQRARPTGNAGPLPRGESAVLAALIQYTDGLHPRQLTVLTGYKRSSRDAYLSRLAEKGYVERAGDRVIATDDGRAALPDAEPLPTGEALRDFWLARLPEGERKTLEVLLTHYPTPLHRDQLDEPTGYKRSSRDAYLSRLAARELVETVGRGEVKAADQLFD